MDALTEMLEGFLHGQEAVRRATVSVNRERYPHIPGLSKYTLYGQAREAVQGAIDARVREVDAHPHGGFAQFLTPSRAADGRWTSTGEVMLYPAERAA